MVAVVPHSGKTGETRVPRALLFVLLLLAALVSPALAKPRVELLVMGPGGSFYERYGHAALRVTDGPGDADRVFNFGITNFKRPNYMAEFLGGRVRFWGNVKTWDYTIARYRREDRTLRRLPLNLSDEQAARLVAKLEHMVLPENREYVYDTFRDNCATKIRDYLDEVTGGAVKAALSDVPSERSFHDDVRVGFANLPHLLLPLELVPGPEMDAPRTLWEMTYHPVTLGEAMKRVQLPTGPLVGPEVVEHTRAKPDPLTGWPLWGQALLWALAAVTAAVGWRLRRAGPRARAAWAFAWFVPTALFGALLVFVHLWSDWPDMRKNWLMAGFFVGDLWLVAPLWRMWRRRAESGGTAVASYLKLRIALMAAITLLGLFVAPLHGNLPPRALALAGLLLGLACLAPRARVAEEVADARTAN
jgi:hypothetical protein